MLHVDWTGDPPTFWTLRLVGNRWVHDSPAHLDHLIPESRNGPTSLDNTVISCPPCNMAKGDSAVGDPGFQLWIARRRRARLMAPPLIAAEEAIYP
jgi:5-methylcytosine-specific restriction endonuclease McrA